ncbi:hypothetical protein CDCA_CDCA02G0667 [Cyanidium caldarium]|uniref:WD repeat-containing protein 75 n=1 Tax=Cyanidium caldarium TaxID=2771 RepID=A0AAV9IQJ5_CYACA|nr:hypothetical protein CDCA_CDCA02G0667 [Cyanidium caldarium]
MTATEAPFTVLRERRVLGGSFVKSAAAWALGGKLLVTGCGRALRVYRLRADGEAAAPADATTPPLIACGCLAGHEGTVTSVTTWPTSQAAQVVSSSLDGTLRIWDVDDGVLIRTIDIGVPVLQCVVNRRLPNVAYVLCRRQFAGTGEKRDRAASGQLPDGAAEASAADAPPNRPAVAAAAARSHRDGRQVTAPTDAVFVAAVDLDKARWRLLYQNNREQPQLVISGDGQALASTGGRIVYVWRCAGQGGLYRFVHPSDDPITALALHPHGGTLAVGDARGVITLYHGIAPDGHCTEEAWQERVRQRKQHDALLGAEVVLQRFHWHAHRVTALQFSADGSLLLSGGTEAVLLEWQLAQAAKATAPRRFYPRLGGTIYGIAEDVGAARYALSIGGHRLTVLCSASVSAVGIARSLAWEPSVYESTDAWHGALAVAGRGRDPRGAPQLATRARCGELHVLDMERDTCVEWLQIAEHPPVGEHGDGMGRERFATDHALRFVVSAHEQRLEGAEASELHAAQLIGTTLKFWAHPSDTKTRFGKSPALVAQFRGAHYHQLALLEVRGRQALSLDRGGALRVWCFEREERGAWTVGCTAAAELSLPAPVRCAAWSDDASTLLVATADATLWVLGVGERVSVLYAVHASAWLPSADAGMGVQEHASLSSSSSAAAAAAATASPEEIAQVHFMGSTGALIDVRRSGGESAALILYDLMRCATLWTVPLAVQHLASIRSGHLGSLLRIDAPVMGMFAASAPGLASVFVFAVTEQRPPVPIALWRQPLGCRPLALLSSETLPLVLVDDDMHVYVIDDEGGQDGTGTVDRDWRKLSPGEEATGTGGNWLDVVRTGVSLWRTHGAAPPVVVGAARPPSFDELAWSLLPDRENAGGVSVRDQCEAFLDYWLRAAAAPVLGERAELPAVEKAPATDSPGTPMTAFGLGGETVQRLVQRLAAVVSARRVRALPSDTRSRSSSVIHSAASMSGREGSSSSSGDDDSIASRVRARRSPSVVHSTATSVPADDDSSGDDSIASRIRARRSPSVVHSTATSVPADDDSSGDDSIASRIRARRRLR